MSTRFGWLPARRRDTISQALRNSVKSWMDDWWMDPKPAVEVDEVASAGGSGGCRVGTAGTGAVLLAPEAEHGVAALGRALAAMPDAADRGDDLSADVGGAALAALAVLLATRCGIDGAAEDAGAEAWPPTVVRAERGGWRGCVRIGDLAIRVGLDRAAVDRLCPPRAASVLPLEPRVRGIESTRVDLRVVLPMGMTKVADMVGLHVGDVLVSDRKLSDAVEVHVKDGRHLAAARLAKTGTRVGIVLVSQVSVQEAP